MYQVKLTKSEANDMACKLQGLAAEWDGEEADGAKYDAFLELMEAHAKTSCRQPITLDAWQVETLADELQNSASAYRDNDDKAIATRYENKAADLFDMLDTLA